MKGRAMYSSLEQKPRISKGHTLSAMLNPPSLLMSHGAVLETEAQRAEVAKLSLLHRGGLLDEGHERCIGVCLA